MSGLTISYNTLTLLTGAGLMLGVLIQRQLVSMLTTPLYVLCLPGLAAALSLAGRFAALVSLVGLLCALVYRFKLWTIIKASSVIIVGATITVLAFRFLAPDEVQARFQESTAYAMIEAFQEFSYSGSLSDTYFGRTIETVVEDMWFLPHDTVTIIFGNSHSGRGDQHYIPSDVGYVLLMFGNGLVGTVLTVWIYLKAILHACMRKDALLSARFMLIYFSAACLLVSVKEQVLLTRHAFTFFVALYLIILSQKVTRRVGRR